MVPFKQLEKTRLGAGGAFGTEQTGMGEPVFHLFEIHKKFLGPEGSPFSHGCGLSRLKMGKGQRGNRLIFLRKPGEKGNRGNQLAPDQAERVIKDQQVGVVPHIAACRAQMNDSFGFRALLAISVHMGHNIVTDFFFAGGGDFIINVIGVSAHFLDLFVGNRKTEFLFRLSERNPQPAPGSEFVIG